MTADDACRDMRLEVSARLDHETDPRTDAAIEEHLAWCSTCRAHEDALRKVRTALRFGVAEEVPDLVPRVITRIRDEDAAGRPGSWSDRLRIAGVAAAVAAIVMFGATRPFGTSPADLATASEIASEVRAAARALAAYRATFRITERGWHPEVGPRRFEAELTFRSPEELRLVMHDRTSYPGEGWPTNDYELVANESDWWVEEHSSCPTDALPLCASPASWAGVIERRAVVHRQPFDGTAPVPTDIVVPLQTLASEGEFSVVGIETIGARPSHHVVMDYRYARPLVESLQVGGAWRPFHPLDQAHVWLDADTWFPLRYEVRAGSSADRAAWAARLGLKDSTGSTLLAAHTISFEEPEEIRDVTFNAPSGGMVRDGGFQAKGLATLRRTAVEVPSRLTLYRAGTVGAREVRAYADGMTYLKVTTSRSRMTRFPLAAEELRSGDGFAYYRPAGLDTGRRVDIFGGALHVSLDSNLPRDALLDIADSADVVGTRAPRTVERAGNVVVRRISAARAFDKFDFALAPTYLPPGYGEAAALHTSAPQSTTVTIYYRRAETELDGVGIRLVQTSGVEFLPPSSEEFIDIVIDGITGRWSVERGELEWLAGDVYRSVAVPSADLTSALAIAQSLS